MPLCTTQSNADPQCKGSCFPLSLACLGAAQISCVRYRKPVHRCACAVLAIKHESSASPALGVIDLCSSSDELDDVQQTSLLLEDSLRSGAARPARSVPDWQHTPMAQQVGTSASSAMLRPAPAGQSADPPFNQASQATHTLAAPSHRHRQP